MRICIISQLLRRSTVIMASWACALLLLAVAILPATGEAQIPRKINYQGYLTTVNGAPLNNAALPVVVKLYDAASGGNLLFTETQNVAVSNGVFSMQIGAVTPLTLSFDRPYFLGVAINGDSEMTPRQALAAAPYALRAVQAELFGTVAQTSGSNTLIDGGPSLPDVGQYNAISIGLDGNPVISYYDMTNGNLKVAKCANPACTGTAVVTTVDNSANNVGRYSSITVPVDGLPVISYADSTAKYLKVAKCANADCSGSATVSSVDTSLNAGVYTSVAIAGDGLPGVAELVSNGLKIVKCVDPACTGTGSILPNTDGPPTTAIGTDGVPLVVQAQFNGNLRFSRCTTMQCTATTTGTLSATASQLAPGLAVLPSGLPVASYLDFTNKRFVVTACADANCYNSSTLQPGAVNVVANYAAFNTADTSLAITLGADGLPVVAIGDPEMGTIKVIRCASFDCAAIASVSTPVTLPRSVGPGALNGFRLHLSLTVGNDGLPVLAYYDPLNRSLRALKCTNAGCTGAGWRR